MRLLGVLLICEMVALVFPCESSTVLLSSSLDDYVLKFLCKKKGGKFLEETSTCYTSQNFQWDKPKLHEKAIEYKPSETVLDAKIRDLKRGVELQAPAYSKSTFQLLHTTMYPRWILDEGKGSGFFPTNVLEEFFNFALIGDFYSMQQDFAKKMKEKCQDINVGNIFYKASVATPQIVRELRFINQNFKCSTETKCLFPVVLKRSQFSKFCHDVNFIINGTKYTTTDASEAAGPFSVLIPAIPIDHAPVEYAFPFKETYCVTIPLYHKDEMLYLSRYYHMKGVNIAEVPINFRMWKDDHPGTFFLDINVTMEEKAYYKYYDLLQIGLDGSTDRLQNFQWQDAHTEFSVICQYDPIDQHKIATDLLEEETLPPKELCDLLKNRNFSTTYDRFKGSCLYMAKTFFIPESARYYDDLSQNCLSTFGYPPRLGNYFPQLSSFIRDHESYFKASPWNVSTAVVVGAMMLIDADVKKNATWYNYGDADTGIEDQVDSLKINHGIEFETLAEWQRRRRNGDIPVKGGSPTSQTFQASVSLKKAEKETAAEIVQKRMNTPFLALVAHIDPQIKDYASLEKNLEKISSTNLTPLKHDFFLKRHPATFLCQFGE